MAETSSSMSSTSSMDGNHDQIVFENIPDQYVKGENVIANFIILHENKVNPNEDQVGLLRVGSTNIQECLAYAPVQFNASTRRGTATFASSSLPTTDDEFYQFCYIVKTRKCLGSSIPFQLNCSIDDIDLLSQSSFEKISNKSNHGGLIALADHDNDDLVIIHTKQMLIEEKFRQENRQLLEINRRLEQQKDECKARFESLEAKSNEYILKVKTDMQLLATTHKATIDELSSRQRLEAKLRAEFDACRSLCNQYQSESLQFAERCRALQESNTQLSNEINKLRAHLTNTTQLNEEQQLQILDFEKRLSQANDSVKTANHYQSQLEQQFRDLRLTSEKYQMSTQAQLDAYIKQASQQENQIHALESSNSLLKDELQAMKNENTHLVTIIQQGKENVNDLQEQIEYLNQQRQLDIEQAENEMRNLRQEIEDSQGNQNSYSILKNSFNEIEKRCLKHQKSEIEVKKQLTVYKEFVSDLQNKVQELTDRLLVGAEEYKTIYRKYAALERMVAKANQQTKTNPTTLSYETGLNEEALVTLLRNSYELQQQENHEEEEEEERPITTAAVTSRNTRDEEEIRECPMCYWEFPEHFKLDAKKTHIDNHFA